MTDPEPKKLSGRLIALTGLIMLATIMQTLDMTIANVALPHMQANLGAGQDQISWVLTSYVVATAIGVSLTGYVVDRFGRTRVFIYSIGGFTIASMLCGLSQTLPEIVVFRVFQGLAGACLVPLSQATLMDLYPREKFGPALAVWGMGVMLGPIFGPTIGGFLTEYLSWRWVFFINLPLGIVCVVGIAALLPETKRNTATKFDMTGFLLIAAALASFQIFLDRGQTLDWFSSFEIVIEAAVAVIALYLFVVHIFTTDRPFLNPALFKDRNYLTGSIFGFSIGVTLLSTMMLLPSMLQSLLGYPIIETGYLMMPRGIGTMLAMAFAGKLNRRVDPRLMMLLGAILIGQSMWEIAGFDLNVTSYLLCKTAFVQGVGMGVLFTSMSILSFATLPQTFRTEGTAIYALIRSIGSSIGISIVSTILVQQTQVNHAELSERITPFNRALQNAAPQIPWNLSSPGGLRALNGEVSRQAAMISYIDVFALMTLITLITLPLIFILRRPKFTASPASTESTAADH